MQPAQVEVRRLLDQIRLISATNPVILRCSDEIEVLCSAYMEPDQTTAGRNIGLNGNVAIIFDLLHKRTGQAVSREAIHNACNHSDGSSDDIKVVDVQICHLRKRLTGTHYEGCVETVRGLGYRLTKPLDRPKGPGQCAKRTSCPKGHRYDAANTYIRTDKHGKKHRVCRKCRVITSTICRQRALAKAKLHVH